MNQTEEAKEKRNRYIPDDFEMDPDFKRPVSYNTTAVHIPTDIFEGCKFTQTRRFCKKKKKKNPQPTALSSIFCLHQSWAILV